jgi:non-specific serine/threonine protein kinase/serine/threonine-protein kinase
MKESDSSSTADTSSPAPATSGRLSEGARARLRRRLRGDLDVIVLKALRKEPQRRYVSVEQMAEDIRRHMEGLPVKAAPDSLPYRARKFVRRHRLAVAATALILFAVVGGIAGTVRQARIAAANQLKAENRFNDVRKLANSLMFEIHDSIQALPGATPARKIIVQRSQEYLNSLARESSGDVSLQRELATAYEKLGQVQGTASVSNLGDARGALESFRKAREIRESVLASGSNRPEDRTALAKTQRLIALVLWMDLDDTAGALQSVRHAVAIAEQATRDAPDDLPAALELAEEYEQLGDILGGNGVRGAAGDLHDALENHRRVVEISKRLMALSPSDVALQQRLGGAYLGVADDLVKGGNRTEALRDYELGRDLFAVLAQDPNNTPFRRGLAICYSRIGDVLLINGKPLDALAAYQQDVKLIEPLAKADPTDVHLQLKLAGATASVGTALIHGHRLAQGMESLSQALALTDGLAGAEHDAQIRSYRAFITVFKGESLQIAGQNTTAQREYREALRIYSALAASDSQDIDDQISLSEVHGHLGSAYLQSGEAAKAADEYREAYTLANSLLALRRDNVEILYAVADASAGLGKACAALARNTNNSKQRSQRWKAAFDWYTKSISSWKQVPNPSSIAPNGFAVVDLSQILMEARIAADRISTARPADSRPADALDAAAVASRMKD